MLAIVEEYIIAYAELVALEQAYSGNNLLHSNCEHT